GFLQLANAAGSQATVNLNAGAVANVGTNTIVGLDANGFATLNVSGVGAVLNTPAMDVAFPNTVAATGDPIPGDQGTVSVTGGGRINTTGIGLTLGDNIQGLGTMTVSGANSALVGTGTGQFVIGNDGTALLNV